MKTIPKNASRIEPKGMECMKIYIAVKKKRDNGNHAAVHFAPSIFTWIIFVKEWNAQKFHFFE